MSNTSASPKAKLSVFQTSPTETLPVLDPIKRAVAAPFEAVDKLGDTVLDYLGGKNSTIGKLVKGAKDALPSELKEAGTQLARGDLVSGVKGLTGFSSFRDITSAVTATDGKVGLDFSSIKERVERNFGIQGGLSGLSPQVQKLITNASESVMGSNAGGINLAGAINDIVQGDFASAKGISDIINRVAGATGGLWDLADLGSVGAFIYGISDKLIEWGAPDMIDAVLDKVEDARYQTTILEELCIRAAGAGSLASVEHYVNKLDADRRLPIAEEVIETLFGSLQYERDERTSSYTNLGSRLLALCNKLDPHWDKDKNNNAVTDLYLYSQVGQVAYNALLTTDRRVFAMTFGLVSMDNAEGIVNEYF